MGRVRAQRGQILPIAALALVGLLGIAAFSIDVGFAYYAKRQLQSATDAAALAGAQDLPNASTAISTATSYAAANTPSNLSSFTYTYNVSCTNTAISAAGCNASVNPNQITVTGSGSTNTWFARIFGISHFSIAAHANACSPCSSTPIDLMLAIDRTGSMCSPTDSQGNCIDLDNAKDGIRTLLGILNPPEDEIGMLDFPPVQTTSTSVCAAPYNSLGNNGYDGYDAATRGYITDPLSVDYKLNGALNPASGLYQHTVDGGSNSCIQAGGNTSYSEALRQADAELVNDGRPNVPKYIVLLTDGEANIGSVYGPNDPTYPPGNSDDTQPCHTAINLANTYKAQNVTIYTIGYALGNLACTSGQWPWIAAQAAVWNAKHTKIITPAVAAHWCDPSMGDTKCYHTAGTTSEPESPAITSNQTLSQIASPGDFYNQPNPGELNTIFAAIASDIGSGTSRLVDDGF
jgi:Putative Flp pilus-assembly TadE/G-like